MLRSHANATRRREEMGSSAESGFDATLVAQPHVCAVPRLSGDVPVQVVSPNYVPRGEVLRNTIVALSVSGCCGCSWIRLLDAGLNPSLYVYNTPVRHMKTPRWCPIWIMWSFLRQTTLQSKFVGCNQGNARGDPGGWLRGLPICELSQVLMPLLFSQCDMSLFSCLSL